MDYLEEYRELVEKYEERFKDEPPSVMSFGSVEKCNDKMRECLKTGKPYKEKHAF